MLKKNYEWKVIYGSHRIRVTTWYDFTVQPYQGGGELLVDNKTVRTWGLMIPQPSKPFVRVTELSDTIKSLNIYGTGAFRPKISIEVNDEFIYQDRLNVIDRFFIKRPKLISKLKKISEL